MKAYALGPRREYEMGRGWARCATVEGVVYNIGVERGRSARIAFKPRGQNRGWHWWGFVAHQSDGKWLWTGRVGKSLGARGLLVRAGILVEKEQSGEKDA